MTLSTVATPIGMRQRSSGVTVVTKAETSEVGGEPVTTQYMVTFVRGASGVEDVGDEAPTHGFDESLREREPDAEVAQTYDADQTYRYAEASGDPMQIHLDEEFAKAVGLPGDHHPRPLHDGLHLGRGARVVLAPTTRRSSRGSPCGSRRWRCPGQTITTRLWKAGEADGRTSYSYETTADSGDVVIKDGLAEIA